MNLFPKNPNFFTMFDELASKIVLYNGLAKNNGKLRAYGNLIHDTTAAIQKLVSALKHRDKRVGDMKRYIHDIHTLENEGDVLIRQSIKELFSRQKNPITLINLSFFSFCGQNLLTVGRMRPMPLPP